LLSTYILRHFIYFLSSFDAISSARFRHFAIITLTLLFHW
jgi:hypothetical protein